MFCRLLALAQLVQRKRQGMSDSFLGEGEEGVSLLSTSSLFRMIVLAKFSKLRKYCTIIVISNEERNYLLNEVKNLLHAINLT